MKDMMYPGAGRGIPGNLEMPGAVERLPNGNTLIADCGDRAGFGSEMIEVDPQGRIIWNYHEGLRFAHSGRRLRNGNTLITDTANNRLVEVTPGKMTIMTSNDWGKGTGRLSDGSHLDYPNEAFELVDGDFLVTDRNNNRVVQVDRDGRLVWSFDRGIHHPHNGRPLKNGNVLICDSDGNRVIEVNRDKEIVWGYGDGSTEMLWWPRGADRLSNGNTLITDSKIGKIIEVSPAGEVVWHWQTDFEEKFYICQSTPEETILVASTFGRRQVIELDRSGNIFWLFRNYRRPYPIYWKLTNGFFKDIGEDGVPRHWILGTRFSEGGGRLIWDNDNKPRPCPGLETDRPGLLMLQQSIKVEPGQVLRAEAQIKTNDLRGSAGLITDYFDAYGCGLYRVITEMPTGNLFTGNNDWTRDAFETKAPPRATYMELALFVNDRGSVFVKNLMLSKV
jgi:hypothetical protein